MLCQLLSRKYAETQNSLLKHEIGFMLGQVGCGSSEHLLKECIENEEEEPIVRHEAIGAMEKHSRDAQYLLQFISHQNALVR